MEFSNRLTRYFAIVSGERIVAPIFVVPKSPFAFLYTFPGSLWIAFFTALTFCIIISLLIDKDARKQWPYSIFYYATTPLQESMPPFKISKCLPLLNAWCWTVFILDCYFGAAMFGKSLCLNLVEV